MRFILTFLGVGLMAVGLTLADQREAEAQYPYTINAGQAPVQAYAAPVQAYVAPVQAYSPAIVGYTAERRGLFGRRTVYRPMLGPAVAQPVAVVAPIQTITQATAIAPITAGRPVLQSQAVYQAPLMTAPVVSRRVFTTGQVVVGRPLIDRAQPIVMGPAPVVMARPMLAPVVVNQPVVVAQPPVINSYYPPVYPTPFAPVSGY